LLLLKKREASQLEIEVASSPLSFIPSFSSLFLVLWSITLTPVELRSDMSFRGFLYGE
jgi:hypothetical protein